MKNKDLVILTSKDKFFGQTRKPWSSLNVDAIAHKIREAGFNVELYDFHVAFNEDINIRNKTVLYAFSQKENYRQYVRDMIYSLSKHNHIIPSYDLLKCHENKGYQEVLKKEIGLNDLKGNYFTSADEVDAGALQYPIVLKTVKGSNGKGVFLLKNEKDFLKVAKVLRNKFSIATHIDLLRRKYIRRKKFKDYPLFSDRQDYLEYKEYLKVEENFVLQQFVPGLSFDYRVLIAHDRYYVMKRDVKKGDFMASGSKMFKFSNIPEPGLLSFARRIYGFFDTPFLSIDVLFDGKEYHLAEFQALHFGTSVVTQSSGYFTDHEQNWQFNEEQPNLENLFSNTLIAYLKK